MKILLVEDETIIALELKQFLEDRGFTVMQPAMSADEASRFALAYRPDVILMDLILIGEKSGIDAALTILQEYQVPIIYITGNEQLLKDPRLQNHPPLAILPKPADPSVLLETLENLRSIN